MAGIYDWLRNKFGNGGTKTDEPAPTPTPTPGSKSVYQELKKTMGRKSKTAMQDAIDALEDADKS